MSLANKSVLGLVFSVLAFSTGAPARAAAPSAPIIPYESLSAGQKALFEGYVTYVNQQTHATFQPLEYWNQHLSESEITTFTGDTQAIAGVKLKNGKDGLSALAAVYQINGQNEALGSALQFNLEVGWIPDAEKLFRAVGFGFRFGTGHPNEHGISLHSSTTGLHLLFSDAIANHGHFHVDYRGLLEGHLKAYNSDVRAIGPETDGDDKPIKNRERHEKWFGLIPGWAPSMGEYVAPDAAEDIED